MEETYKKASKNKVRFITTIGSLTVEDLWDIPLTSARGVSLDNIAKELNKAVKNSEEESFVLPVIDKRKSLDELKFEIVKDIIKTQLTARDARKNAALKKETKQRILALIADKENDELAGKSKEDLLKMVEDL